MTDFQESVAIKDATGTTRLYFSSSKGDFRIFSASGEQVVHLDRTGGLILGGGSNEHGDIFMYNSRGQQSIHISGEAGDVILKNADAAEDFTVLNAADVTPGTVLVIDDHNRLRPSSSAYDRRVAGVVSGAASYKPGIVLDRQEDSENRLPVALAGKVYVNVDASFRPISVGDLLTTSSFPGYAMCAADPARAFGAVIGKALAPLAEGRGSVPILVSLQ